MKANNSLTASIKKSLRTRINNILFVGGGKDITPGRGFVRQVAVTAVDSCRKNRPGEYFEHNEAIDYCRAYMDKKYGLCIGD